MPSYISSQSNRIYGATETAYGTVASVAGAQRLPAVSLAVKSEAVVPVRRDKTGTRSVSALAAPLRRDTSFSLRAYHTSWLPSSQSPTCGPLIAAAVGSPARVFAGGTVEATPGPQQIRFSGPHQLTVGQAVSFNGELRFVTLLVDAVTVEVNCPFSTTPAPGAQIGLTTTYLPSATLPSVSIFDYWSPEGAVQRILCGAAVDQMKISLNGDFHELEFKGRAADVIDSSSFASGQGALSSYPMEPPIASYQTQPVPGHLGQAWLGAPTEQFFTITEAEIRISNGLEMRNREFGSLTPGGFGVGQREVTVTFGLYGQDDTATRALYQAARQRSPIHVMFQMGQQTGQLMGVMMKSVVADVPQYADNETRLRWTFSNNTAYGFADDEICVAFG